MKNVSFMCSELLPQNVGKTITHISDFNKYNVQ